jgi:hypothetical protein
MTNIERLNAIAERSDEAAGLADRRVGTWTASRLEFLEIYYTHYTTDVPWLVTQLKLAQGTATDLASNNVRLVHENHDLQHQVEVLTAQISSLRAVRACGAGTCECGRENSRCVFCEKEIERLQTALDMVAEERDAWKARALGQPVPPCRHAGESS